MSHWSGDDAPSDNNKTDQDQQRQDHIEGEILIGISMFTTMSKPLHFVPLSLINQFLGGECQTGEVGNLGPCWWA